MFLGVFGYHFSLSDLFVLDVDQDHRVGDVEDGVASLEALPDRGGHFLLDHVCFDFRDVEPDALLSGVLQLEDVDEFGG